MFVIWFEKGVVFMAKILVVEDEENVCLLYRTELEAEGYSVVVANDGKTAVQKASEEEPDLIVMDINLPEKMDGLEAMSKIHGLGKSIPIILNTGYSQYRDNFLAWAAEDYIVKSGDLTELKESITRILGGPQRVGKP